MLRNYTNSEIKDLIACPKCIVEAPRRTMFLTEGHYRNSLELRSIDGEHRFHVFMRKNVKFEENFTIGLEYIPGDGSGSICLFRCNGPHGEHMNEFESASHFFGYHIHIAKEEYVNSGYKSDKYAEITNRFATFQDALAYFVSECNIIDVEKYFPAIKTISLFDDEEL